MYSIRMAGYEGHFPPLITEIMLSASLSMYLYEIEGLDVFGNDFLYFYKIKCFKKRVLLFKHCKNIPQLSN